VVPQKHQMKLHALQCNCVFKAKFENGYIKTFDHALDQLIPK